MPRGTARTVARPVISRVPSTAGPIPPAFAGSTDGGMGLVRNDQLMAEAPLAITVTSTNPSGMITRTNENTISAVAIRLLARRQDGGSRRALLSRSSVDGAIRYPGRAARSAPPRHGPQR